MVFPLPDVPRISCNDICSPHPIQSLHFMFKNVSAFQATLTITHVNLKIKHIFVFYIFLIYHTNLAKHGCLLFQVSSIKPVMPSLLVNNRLLYAKRDTNSIHKLVSLLCYIFLSIILCLCLPQFIIFSTCILHKRIMISPLN